MKRLFSILRFLLILSIAGFILIMYLYLASPSFLKCFEPKYYGPEYERNTSWMIDEYAHNYCKNRPMELLHVGNFTDAPNHYILFGLWLRSYAKQNLQEARLEAVTLVQDFWKTIEHDTRSIVSFEQSKKFMPPEYRDRLSLNLVGVKIAYWDKNVNRPLPPYISEVTFYNSTFCYYEADPRTQALRIVLEESFDDACRLVSSME